MYPWLSKSEELILSRFSRFHRQFLESTLRVHISTNIIDNICCLVTPRRKRTFWSIRSLSHLWGSQHRKPLPYHFPILFHRWLVLPLRRQRWQKLREPGEKNKRFLKHFSGTALPIYLRPKKFLIAFRFFICFFSHSSCFCKRNFWTDEQCYSKMLLY